MNTSYNQRLEKLEFRFIGLEEPLSDTTEKEAISILDAIL